MVSDEHFVRVGVPQGSVLGPILYLIYENDINHNPVKSNIGMFADDSVLLYSDIDPHNACNVLEEDLGKILKYFGGLKLMINASKTKVMYFPKHLRGPVLNIFPKTCLNGTAIDVVDKFKYLGIHIDNRLNFLSHLKTIILTFISQLWNV